LTFKFQAAVKFTYCSISIWMLWEKNRSFLPFNSS